VSVSVYAQIYTYVHTHTRICAYIHSAEDQDPFFAQRAARIADGMSGCPGLCIYMNIYIYIYIYIYTNIHTHTHTNAYIHTYIHSAEDQDPFFAQRAARLADGGVSGCPGAGRLANAHEINEVGVQHQVMHILIHTYMNAYMHIQTVRLHEMARTCIHTSIHTETHTYTHTDG
jgi:hypothetical protein